ncbi:MAG: HIT domain-containing protein [Pyrinomonadaceae bacterium]
MDRLWSPWRGEYIASATASESSSACVFCEIQADPRNDKQNFVLDRARFNFVVLNIHPYSSGHMLIVPYEHTAELRALSKETSDELMDLTKHAETAIRAAYKPDGINLGMNLGRAAGAGIAGHVHVHILPRWKGDTNFMTTVGETRVLPEDLPTTFARLHDHFAV